MRLAVFLLLASLSQAEHLAVTLSYSVNGQATGFLVERASNPRGPYSPACGLDLLPECPTGSQMSFTDPNVQQGRTYFYSVGAFGNPQSQPVRVTVLMCNAKQAQVCNKSGVICWCKKL